MSYTISYVKYDVVCLHTILYVYIRYLIWRTILYNCNDIVRQYTMSYVRRTMSYVCFEGTSQRLQIFPIPPAQGMGIWAESFLQVAPFFRLRNQCRRARNTAIFYIKIGYSHAPFWWTLDQWTVQTPSIGVSEPRCTIPGAAGWFSPAIQGAGWGFFWERNGANSMKTAVSATCVGLSMRAELL